jgi:hypothetical protein
MVKELEQELRIKAMEFALRNKPSSYTDYGNALSGQAPKIVNPKYELIDETEKIYQYLKTGTVPEQKQTT